MLKAVESVRAGKRFDIFHNFTDSFQFQSQCGWFQPGTAQNSGSL